MPLVELGRGCVSFIKQIGDEAAGELAAYFFPSRNLKKMAENSKLQLFVKVRPGHVWGEAGIEVGKATLWSCRAQLEALFGQGSRFKSKVCRNVEVKCMVDLLSQRSNGGPSKWVLKNSVGLDGPKWI